MAGFVILLGANKSRFFTILVYASQSTQILASSQNTFWDMREWSGVL